MLESRKTTQGTKRRPRSSAEEGDVAPDVQKTETKTVPAFVSPADLRRFHLIGKRPSAHAPTGTLVPRALEALAALNNALAPATSYPVFLPADTQEPVRPLTTCVREVLAQETHTNAQLIKGQEHYIALSASLLMKGKIAAGEAITQACANALDAFDVSDAGRKRLEAELQAIEADLPKEGDLLGLSQQTFMHFYGFAVEKERAPIQRSFRHNVERLHGRLEEVLMLADRHSEAGQTKESLSLTLGETGGSINFQALSKNLPQYRGSKRMDVQRRERVELTRTTLKGFLDRDAQERPIVVHYTERKMGIPEGFEVIAHASPLKEGCRVFDERAQEMLKVVRAVRIAELECAGKYEEAVHDEVFQYFGDDLLNSDELALMPSVLVLEDAERFAQTSVEEFGDFLTTGRPVHLALERYPLNSAGVMAKGYQLDFCQLAMAGREAFVAQGSLLAPGVLARDLRAMVASYKPGVVTLTCPDWQSDVDPAMQLNAALFGRVGPVMTYAPSTRLALAHSFSLEGNPRPEKLFWAATDIEEPRASGTDSSADAVVPTRGEALTFAHMAALHPSFRDAFLLINEDSFADGQVPVADYLELAPGQRFERVPYIEVNASDGAVQRAVLNRELVFVCDDYRRAWMRLREWGGIDNAYVKRAIANARDAAVAEQKAEASRLLEEHAKALVQAREEATANAMDRLVSVLLNTDVLPMGGIASAAPSADAASNVRAESQMPAIEAPTAAPPDVDEHNDDAEDVEEAYIDGDLCTSCNECTNLNGMLFKYNADQQAYIADINAGSFRDLVLAAEKCPALCIHPGLPRSGDESATEEMVTRAAAFN